MFDRDKEIHMYGWQLESMLNQFTSLNHKFGTSAIEYLDIFQEELEKILNEDIDE